MTLQIRFRLGLCSRPNWGGHDTLADPVAKIFECKEKERRGIQMILRTISFPHNAVVCAFVSSPRRHHLHHLQSATITHHHLIHHLHHHLVHHRQ